VSDYFLGQLEKGGPERKLRHQRVVGEGHGRSETRETSVAPAMVAPGVWLGLASVILVIRRCVEHATGQSSDEVRYFISSLPAKVKRLAGAMRPHRGVENGLHWVLDVAFDEDRMRRRDRNGIENLGLLNRLAVSVLRQDKTIKAGVKCKRKAAGWDDNYLLQLLFDCQ
jgi:predicted transposase YbfD/YdcC